MSVITLIIFKHSKCKRKLLRNLFSSQNKIYDLDWLTILIAAQFGSTWGLKTRPQLITTQMIWIVTWTSQFEYRM